MSTAMDEQQMLLIMKYYDGECSEVEVLQAERLLSEGDEAGLIMANFSSLGGIIEEWGHTVQSRTTWVPDVNAMMEEVELRQRSYTRLTSGSEVKASLSGIRDGGVRGDLKGCHPRGVRRFWGRLFEKKESRGYRHEPEISNNFDFWHGLGWASSGALVAASLVLLFGISGNLSYFNWKGSHVASGGEQTAGVKVVSAESLITGGDKGSAGTSFVNEHEPTSRIAQPLAGAWEQKETTTALFEELKEVRRGKKQHLEDE